MADDYVYPEAHEALAFSSLARAHDLERARFALQYETIHGTPPGLTDSQIVQRKAILSIAEEIIKKGRDREMENAIAHWHSYKVKSHG